MSQALIYINRMRKSSSLITVYCKNRSLESHDNALSCVSMCFSHNNPMFALYLYTLQQRATYPHIILSVLNGINCHDRGLILY